LDLIMGEDMARYSFAGIVVAGLIFCLTPRAAQAQAPSVTWLSTPVAAATPNQSELAVIPLAQFIGPKPINNGQNPFGNSLVATGRVTAITHGSGRVIVGTANGGVWLTSNSTSTPPSFSPIFDDGQSQAIGALGIDTTVSTPIIYVGTGEANQSSDSYYGAGLFEILNWGTTWIQIGDPTFTGMAFPSLAVIGAADPTVQNGKAHIFAGLFAGSTTTKEGVTTTLGPHVGSMGLWRSSDGGSTWSQYAATSFPPISGYQGSPRARRSRCLISAADRVRQ
jgi:hypothetical protein